MKRLLVSAFALFALTAHADVSVGNLELVIYGDADPGFSSISVSDEGGKIVGLGGSQVYLERQNGGYKGNAFGRFFDLTCSGDQCTDNGSTQAQFAVKYSSGGFTADGTLNFASVHITVTDQTISVSAGGFNTSVGYELDRNRDGSFSGDGALGGASSFTANLTSSGTLQGLKDPAAAIILLAGPFVRN